MLRSTHMKLQSCALIALVAAWTPAVYAQDAKEEAAEKGAAGFEDIVVTAQRKSESLAKVPVSVQAFDAEAIQKNVIVSERDLTSLVPGLFLKTGQVQNQLSFSMRGQTLDPFSGSSPSVLPYLNEVPYGGGTTETPLFDLESVQVLKGPQGTLFGRNATGGAVLFTTPKPGNEFGGNVILRFGERNMSQIQTAIDLPLVKDILSVRLAGDVKKQRGYVTNINTGNTLGDTDSRAGRITVQFTPNDQIENTFIAQYAKMLGTELQGGLFSFYKCGDTNNGFALTCFLDAVYNNANQDGPAAPGKWPGAVDGYLEWQKNNPYKIWLQYDLPHYATTTFISNTTSLKLGETMTVKNIFGYTDSFSRIPNNLAGSPFGALWLFNNPPLGDGPPGSETFEVERFSNELQLQGSLAGESLEYIVGGFYTNEKQPQNISMNIGGDLAPGGLADVVYRYATKNTSKAVFGQFTYNATDKLTIAAGGRYSWDYAEISHAFSPVGIVLFNGAPTQMKKDSAPSWTFNVQYQIDPSNMVYFSQRGSYRAGSWNGTVNPANDVNYFKNETTYDFEVGYKLNGFVGSMPTRFNVAAYRQHVKNAQHFLNANLDGNPAGFTVNVPKKRIQGLEVDVSLGLTDWLSVGGTFAYTDAKFTNGVVDLSRVTGVAGYKLPFTSYTDTPKYAGTAFVEVSLPVPSNLGEMSLRGDTEMQSSVYFGYGQESNTPGNIIPKYSIFNLRYDWKEIMGSQVSFAIYAKNITDKFYYAGGYDMGSAQGYNTIYAGEPQTFATELSIKF